MIRRPPRSTLDRSSAASDVYKRQVLNVWKRVDSYARDGYTAVIHGKHYHEETQATASQATKHEGGKYLVVFDMAEARMVCDVIEGKGDTTALAARFAKACSPGFDFTADLRRIGVANQTTMLSGESMAIANEVRASMGRRYGQDTLGEHFRTFDTICSATQERQDAVIIGSSHAYRGYDPFVFQERGHKVFNLGSSAQTPLNTYPLIQQYLDSAHCPMLIYDVYEGSFTNTGLESTADLTQNQPSDAAALDMAWAIRDLRGLNMMALRMLTGREKPYYTSTYYQGLGFCAIPDSVNKQAPPPPGKQIELSPVQRHFFEACIRLLSLIHISEPTRPY